MYANPNAGFALLAGWRPSLSAAYLAALGSYGYAVGNHSHNGFLHLLLLALVACSADGLSLRRLVGGRDTDARCPTRVLPGIAHLERGISAAIAGVAGPLSVATSVGEMAIAVGLTLRRLWPLAMAGNIAFALSLELLLVPAMFPWDLLALMILFLPAADGAYRVHLNASCGTCRSQWRVLMALDWTRRLDVRDTVADRGPFSIETPAGRRFTGWRAIGLLPWVVPAPFLSLLILLRFGSEFVGRRTVGFSLDDVVFVVLPLGTPAPAGRGSRGRPGGIRAGRLGLEPRTVPRAGCCAADGCLSAAPRHWGGVRATEHLTMTPIWCHMTTIWVSQNPALSEDELGRECCSRCDCSTAAILAS